MTPHDSHDAELIDRIEQQLQQDATTTAAPLRLGDFLILREVGRGGMGVVYEAEQVSLGRRVALKVLPQGLLPDTRSRLRFEREARAAARLHHTNIVPVFGVGEHDGTPYYAMQFIQGLGLDAVINEVRRLQHPGTTDPADPTPAPTLSRRDVSAADMARSLFTRTFQPPLPENVATATHDFGPQAAPPPAAQAMPTAALPDTFSLSTSVILPGQSEAGRSGRHGYWQSVASIGVQVADALEYAHKQGFLHRDIKPSNLLLDTAGIVWVTDFGLAKATADDANLTGTGDIVGTLRYLAPERFSGPGDVRSDVYALGLTLYELLTLRPAFTGGERNQLIKRILHDDPTPPRKINPAIPRDLETVVLKALAREPERRYQTPGELAADLKRFLDDRPVSARPVGEVEKLWRWCRRNSTLTALAACLLATLVLGLIGVCWKWLEAEQQREEAHRSELEARAERLEAQDERKKAQDERKKALEAQARAEAALKEQERAAKTADQVADFLVGLFEPRNRIAIGATSLGFSGEVKDTLRAGDLLKRGLERLNTAELKEQPLVRARLLHEIGTIYFGLGQTDAAAPLLEEALRLRRQLRPGHPDLARSLLGAARMRLVHENPTAPDLLREAIAILRKQPDPESLELAEAETILAVYLLQYGTDEAREIIPLMERARAIRVRRLGPYDLQTISTTWLFADFCLRVGDKTRALKLHAEVMEAIEKCPDDPELIACIRLSTRAFQTMLVLGPRAALPGWRQTLAQVRKVFGDDHFLTVWAKLEFGRQLYDVGDHELLVEAVRSYEECAKSSERWGISRRWVLGSIHHQLGRTLIRLSRLSEAEKELRQAVAQFRKARPEQNHDLPHTLQLLAYVCAHAAEPEKRAEVEGLLKEAVAVSRTNPNVPAFRRAHALMDYGRCRLSRGDAAAVVPLFTEAHALRSQEADIPRVEVAEALAFRSAALRKLGQTEAADADQRAAEQLLTVPGGAPSVAHAHPRSSQGGCGQLAVSGHGHAGSVSRKALDNRPPTGGNGSQRAGRAPAVNGHRGADFNHEE